jgi:RNA polymerase sigma-70 factor (ECF subfamily)
MSTPTTLHALRPLVFSIAYRMLGTITDAEDVAQEAMLRIHRGMATGEELRNPDAFATTVTTRLALDAARATRRRRETYVGAWLPEPILSDDADPAHRLEVDEAVSIALLAVLQRLSPAERAVYLLRETFGYDYGEIAVIVGKSEVSCRQLFSRARRHVADADIRFEPSAEQRLALASAFFAAIRSGNVGELESLLAADIVMEADGGGHAPARRTALIGSTAVARFLLGLARQGARHDLRTEPVVANGQPAALFTDATGAVLGVMCLDLRDGTVAAVHTQINPEKLGHLGRVGDLAALLAAPSET